MMRQPILLPLLLAGTAFLLGACGTKGALTLPPGGATPPLLGNPTPTPAPTLGGTSTRPVEPAKPVPAQPGQSATSDNSNKASEAK